MLSLPRETITLLGVTGDSSRGTYLALEATMLAGTSSSTLNNTGAKKKPKVYSTWSTRGTTNRSRRDAVKSNMDQHEAVGSVGARGKHHASDANRVADASVTWPRLRTGSP